MRPFVRRCGVAWALVLLAAPAAAAAERVREQVAVPAATIAAELARGDVVLEDRAVTGHLDLAGREVRSLFKCRECTFRGRISASDASFARTLDLSGSTFERKVDFRGATFLRPALFRAGLARAGTRPTTFRKDADFSLAFFEEFSSFAGARFDAEAAFRDTRFTDASFAGARLTAAAFERAFFRGVALFNDVVFRQAAVFREADFRRRADFSQAQFRSGASFTRAQFTADASFLAARFRSADLTDPSRRATVAEEAARFQAVASTGNLDFTFASFTRGRGRPPDPEVVAVFSDLVSGRSLVLRNATFAPGQRVVMLRVQVRDLVLDVDAVEHVDGAEQQAEILEKIEESAKARGDIAEANDAHFELRVLRSSDYGPVRAVFDYFVYRFAAGYLVRPEYPLVLLIVIVGVVALVRALLPTRGATPAAAAAPEAESGAPAEPAPLPERRPRTVSSRVRAAPGWLWRLLSRLAPAFLTNLLDAFALLVPQRADGPGKVALGVRLEAFLYRILFVFALLGLANSNPTLREMVDTLF